MVGKTSTMHEEIEKQLDIDLITQHISHGAFYISNKTEWILKTMQELCAPIRDATVKDLSTQTDLVVMFER